MTQTSAVLHIGVDLGTSHSAVSASNGERHVIESYVGWPVDMVARKVVKKTVLIGRDALDNRSMLDLRRPLEKGVMKEGSEKDAAAVHELLRHLVGLVKSKNGADARQKIHAVVGVPAGALRASKQTLREVLKGTVDSLMIVSEPFAVAYGLEELLHSMIIDIGAGTIDFCVMNGRYPTDEEQRSLTIAGDTVDGQLAKLVGEKYPGAQFSIHMIREWKEKWSFVGEPKQRAVVTVPVSGKPTSLDITNEVRAACEQLLPPVSETILDLLSRVEPEYQERVRNNLILAGGGSRIAGLGHQLQESLVQVGHGKVRIVEDPVFAGSDGGLALALDAADSDWEQLTA
jgi:rod shape-determining protein MreB